MARAGRLHRLQAFPRASLFWARWSGGQGPWKEELELWLRSGGTFLQLQGWPGWWGEGEALVKEGFLEEVGQSRDWKEGRDRVRGKEKKRKSSSKGNILSEAEGEMEAHSSLHKSARFSWSFSKEVVISGCLYPKHWKGPHHCVLLFLFSFLFGGHTWQCPGLLPNSVG